MTNRKSLVRQADKAFGDYIKERDNHVCVTCGAEDHMDCGHLFTRAAYSTRWAEQNAFAQCRGCNLRHEYDPGPLTIYFLRMFGKDAYENLHRVHKTTVKYHDDDLQKIIDRYRCLLANLRLARDNGWRGE